MAAGELAEVGSEYGACCEVDPCEHEACVYPCEHDTCESTRTMAAVPCRVCNETIGIRRFFNDTPDGERGYTVLVHELCLYDELDKAEREANK